MSDARIEEYRRMGIKGGNETKRRHGMEYYRRITAMALAARRAKGPRPLAARMVADVHVFLLREEKDWLVAAAGQLGVSQSGFLRELLEREMRGG